MTQEENNRILIVDDNPAIHADFRKILAPEVKRAVDLAAAEAILFGQTPPSATRKTFEIDSAFQGEEALSMLRSAQAAGRPYALAFVDVRMPPGWDGVQTMIRLWEVAPDLQIVLCTAYSDYSWQEVAEKVSAPHNLVVLKKPFDNIEVLLLAHALCYKWAATQAANAQLEQLNAMVAERTCELDRTNAELRQEIGERRRGEEILRESEERFRAFMDNSPVVAFTKDRNGRYVYLNKAFEKQFGLSRDDATRTDFDLWPAEVAAEMQANDAVVLEAGESREFLERMPLPGRDENQWLVLKFPIRDRHGDRFVGGVAVDITERTQLESQRRQSQKLEAVGQLAGGVAHDFNNILAVIIGYTETLMSLAEPEGTLAQNLSEILKAADRGTGLIAQLLAFSRNQVTWPRIIDVNSTIIDIDKILHRIAGEDIYFTLLLGPEGGCIKAEPGQIEQLIVNLVVNARDSMATGGELRVETEQVVVSNSEAEAEGVTPGEYVLVQVADTGTGMSPETQAHIFEPFFTTKEDGKGTGLGLATCYGIAKQSGGFIRVESELGKGTTFRVYLPRVEPAAVPDLPHPPRASELPKGDESILVVEDEESLREVTVATLRELGYKVREAADGEIAQRMLSASDGIRVDLVLTDVGMPRLDGVTLAHWLETHRPEVRVLLVSGYAGDKRLRDEDVALDHRFLAKPFTRAQLATAVRKALEHKRETSPVSA
ncbi:MAG TPA: response regulator [Chthoniobacterales bacterium]|nr:response regulator [Chthoniobacterales bacterium]